MEPLWHIKATICKINNFSIVTSIFPKYYCTQLSCVKKSCEVRVDNVNANDNNTTFTKYKDTKLNAPVVTLSSKNNQKLLDNFGKGLERSVYWN